MQRSKYVLKLSRTKASQFEELGFQRIERQREIFRFCSFFSFFFFLISALAFGRKRKSTRLRATSVNHRQDTREGNGYRVHKRISNQDIGAVLAAGNLPLDWSTTGIFSLICTPEGAFEKSMTFFLCRVPRVYTRRKSHRLDIR